MFGCVAIVGVGLIGASIGLALKQRRLCDDVLGIGRRTSSLEAARKAGALDRYALGIGPELQDVELLLLCVPVDRIVDTALESTAHLPAGALITDAGSTKAVIVGELERRLPAQMRFIGSHPLAGSEARGPEAGSAQLLEGRTCVITPTQCTAEDAVSQATDFWTALGMRVTTLTPSEHDRILARTSHLPHLVACALASVVADEELPFVGSGLRDTTRIAAGGPDLWTAIFQQNRGAVLAAITEYQLRVDEIRSALEQQDDPTLERLLANGKRHRDAMGR